MIMPSRIKAPCGPQEGGKDDCGKSRSRSNSCSKSKSHDKKKQVAAADRR